MCAYDKDRVCDESCAGRVPEDDFILHEAVWDTSLPVPQFQYVKAVTFKAEGCGRDQGFPIWSTAKEFRRDNMEKKKKKLVTEDMEDADEKLKKLKEKVVND
jgi:hypothetical protein